MGFGYEGKPFQERRVEGAVIMRNPSMPIIGAVTWWLVFSWIGLMGLSLLFDAVFPARSPVGDAAYSITALGFLALCVRSGTRSLRARVVVSADGIAIHNMFVTTRIGWATFDGTEIMTFFNTQAFLPQRWYGIALRVTGRRRRVGILASWAKDSQSAAAFADRIRSLGPQPHPAWIDQRWDRLPDSLRRQYPRLGIEHDL